MKTSSVALNRLLCWSKMILIPPHHKENQETRKKIITATTTTKKKKRIKNSCFKAINGINPLETLSATPQYGVHAIKSAWRRCFFAVLWCFFKCPHCLCWLVLWKNGYCSDNLRWYLGDSPRRSSLLSPNWKDFGILNCSLCVMVIKVVSTH